MPKLLFIGSAVADVVVRVNHLPVIKEDILVNAQSTSLGGCACNAFFAARRMHLADCTLYAPIGTGMWADFVRAELLCRGVVSAAPQPDRPNGCCYCLVDATGERSFMSDRGAEYRFDKEWLDTLPISDYDGVYLCGMEAEEVSGDILTDALERCPAKTLYFAPGPRIVRIDPVRLQRIWALHPVVHLNEQEACGYTGCNSVQEAAEWLHSRTNNDVYVTLGERGCYIRAKDFTGIIPGEPAEVVNTIGAGDAHVGTLMACRSAGMAPEEAVRCANHASAMVVAQVGAILEDEENN